MIKLVHAIIKFKSFKHTNPDTNKLFEQTLWPIIKKSSSIRSDPKLNTRSLLTIFFPIYKDNYNMHASDWVPTLSDVQTIKVAIRIFLMRT